MANVLNLALKKEIFDGLMNKTITDIPIEKSKWWTKRLTDLETGEFKPFDMVKASCGSADKVDFEIEKISKKGNFFIISVKSVDENVEDEVIGSEQELEQKPEPELEPEPKPEPEPVNEKPVHRYEAPKIKVKENTVKKYSIEEEVDNILRSFYAKESVFPINGNVVNIRKNGRIIGTNYKIAINSDCDIIIQMGEKEIMKYNDVDDIDFISEITKLLNNTLKGNYVFLNKKVCGLKKKSTGEYVFVLKYASRKKYLFNTCR